ncbi:MAG: DUF5667 domain-containing protein [Patescibacteria group bacterium]|nr:DUF5667 domain-containing protein [Patescibacteria group bacterium]
MTDKELLNLMKETGRRIEFSPVKKEALKDSILARLENEKSATNPQRVPFWLRLADTFVPANLTLRPVASFSLVMALFLITSFATVNASKNALPGNPLYNVKIGAERLRYFVAFSDEARAKASMEIAQKRAAELKQLMSVAEGPNKDLLGAVVSQQLANELDNVKEQFNKIKNEEKDAVKLAAVAKDVDARVAAIERELPIVSDKNNLKNVLAKTEEVKFVILSTYVDQYQAGVVDFSKEAMVEKITAQLNQILEKANKLEPLSRGDQENLAMAKELLKEAKRFLAEENLSVAWLKLQEANEIINGLDIKINGGIVEGESVEINIPTSTPSTTVQTGQMENSTASGDIILNDWLNSQEEQSKEEFKVEIK